MKLKNTLTGRISHQPDEPDGLDLIADPNVRAARLKDYQRVTAKMLEGRWERVHDDTPVRPSDRRAAVND